MPLQLCGRAQKYVLVSLYYFRVTILTSNPVTNLAAIYAKRVTLQQRILAEHAQNDNKRGYKTTKTRLS